MRFFFYFNKFQEQSPQGRAAKNSQNRLRIFAGFVDITSVKVRTKLILVVCALILAMMFQYGGFHLLMGKSREASSSVALYLSTVDLFSSFRSSISKIKQEISGYILSHEQSHLNKIPELLQKTGELLDRLRRVQEESGTRSDKASKLIYFETRKIYEEGKLLAENLLNNASPADTETDRTESITEWQKYEARLNMLMKKISVANRRILDQTLSLQENLSAAYTANFNYATIIFLLALLVALAASGVIKVQIVGGVQKLCSRLKAMEESGPGGRIEPWSSDEFNEIVSAINRLSSNLAETTVSRVYLNDILDSMQEALFVLDSDGTIKNCNLASEKLLNRSRSDLIGSALHDYIADRPDSGRGDSPLITAAESGVHVEYKLASDSSAGPKTVLASWRKLDSAVTFGSDLYITTLTDISEKKALEAQLIHAQKIDAIGQLAGGVAHDFNNLLAGIGGSVHILKKRVVDNTPALEQLEIVSQCVTQASDLTKKLLGLSRKAQHGQDNIRLAASFEQVIGILEKTMPKDIAIESHVPKGTWYAVGDASQLASVLINLALNARDAIQGKGVIKFFAENEAVSAGFDMKGMVGKIKPGNYVRISVQDSGRGIPDDIRDKIFEPFFTTKQIGSGTGLGLSMAAEIVKKHNGAIRVSSQKGLGTCIDIYLPANDKAEDSSDYELLSVKGIENKNYDVLKGKRIMLVDDEHLVRTVTTKFLEQQGCEVIPAENGEVALELIKDVNGKKFDVIILDVIMPRKDGIETFNEIRRITPSVPVVFYSGYAESEHLAKQQGKLNVAFISKPYLPEEFLDALVKAVGFEC